MALSYTARWMYSPAYVSQPAYLAEMPVGVTSCRNAYRAHRLSGTVQMPSARPFAWPRPDDPTQNGPFGMKTPGCAATCRHTGDCRGRQTRARSAYGSRPSSNRLSPNPPPMGQPRSTPPSVFSGWGSTFLDAHCCAGSAGCPCRAPRTPSARHRETGRAPPPALAHHRHEHVMHQEVQQHGDAPHQAYLIFVIGVLEVGL